MSSFQINVPLDMDGQQIKNGVAGVDPTDFVIVSQLTTGGGIDFVTANSGTYLTIETTGSGLDGGMYFHDTDGGGAGIWLQSDAGSVLLEADAGSVQLTSGDTYINLGNGNGITNLLGSGTLFTVYENTGVTALLTIREADGLMIPTLPTSDPGVTGALYNLLGVVRVSP